MALTVSDVRVPGVYVRAVDAVDEPAYGHERHHLQALGAAAGIRGGGGPEAWVGCHKVHTSGIDHHRRVLAQTHGYRAGIDVQTVGLRAVVC